MVTQKKYVSLAKLSTFLDNLKNTFASIGHKHAISDLTDYTVDTSLSSTSTNPVQNKVVQAALNGKAASSHGTHVSYSTAAPVMDGSASAGSASTVARSDHKHPTDTTRAAKTDLNSHTSNTTVHITSAERTNWNAAIDDITNIQSSLDTKANTADIAQTVYSGFSNSATVYVKISDFGSWGTGAWYQKGFSMLLTSRAGELVWVSLAANDSNTTAKAFRLINTYSKIKAIHYSASESAIYCTMVAWCNNLCAHILTNVNGDYVPTVTQTQADALPDDAVEINIVEFGISSNGTQVGDTSVNLLLGGAATRPTYNGNDVALKSDVDAITLDTLGGNDRYYTESEIDSKLSGKSDTSHTHSQYVNQNAFSNVVVGSTTVAADSATDTLTLAGSNVTLTPDATNDKVTIGITKANVTAALGYTPPTTNTTYSAATTSAAGLMSASDKSKLDGIASGANAYSLPTATSSTLGGVKTGSNITNSSGTISLTKANVTSALGYTPPTTNTTYSAATTSAAGLMSASDKSKLDGIASGATKITVDSALSSSSTNPVQNKVINTALAGKAASSHTHNYAGSSSSGGAATSANKLNTNAGDSNTPVYFSNGVPVACTSLDLNTTGSSASCTGNAATATKATQDDSGNVITSTYMTKANPTGSGYVSIGRKSGTTVGTNSVAMGNNTTASGDYSTAIGGTGKFDSSSSAPIASGYASIAMGSCTEASGTNAFSIGYKSIASGQASVAMGYGTNVSSIASVAMGNNTTASGDYSTAMGFDTTASGDYSTAMGFYTTASGKRSTAMGYYTTASGDRSTAMGYYTTASGDYSVAMGNNTTALDYQVAIGRYNNQSNATAATSSQGASSGTAFVIGNGTSGTASNAFRVNYDGMTYGKSAYTTTGCDYAEYFEWLDSNPDNEDRRGYFVTLDGERIKIAEPGDYILGIISGHPAVIGNGDEDWMGRYILDDFGDIIYEDFEYEVEEPEEVVDEETGEVTTQMKTVKRTCKKYKENPDYDPSIAYIQREDRPEWDAVGMVGVLSVRDDGTCQVNGYCKVAEGGTATTSDSGYRVVKRVNDNIVKVIFK